MPYADPDRERAWRAAYQRPPVPTPITRLRILDEDIAQARALAELESRRIGHVRAADRLAAWLRSEYQWIRRTVEAFPDEH